MKKEKIWICSIAVVCLFFSYPLIVLAFELPANLFNAFHERSKIQSDMEAKLSLALDNIGKNLLLENTRGAREMFAYRKVVPSVVFILTDRGIGSGVMISRKGFLITNWHVVRNIKKIVVVFKPKDSAELKRELAFDARLIKTDPVRDLALLKIDYPFENLSFMDLADPSGIAVGENAHAIGHPTGENWTYTKGIISQIRPNYQWKTSDGILHRAKVIQTQTPVSPGSSGGPLFNDQGQLLGINSFIKSGAEGLNYAVAVDEIQRFLSEKSSQASGTPQTENYPDSNKKGKPQCSEAYDTRGEGWNNILGCYFPGENPPPDFWCVLASENGPIKYALRTSNKNGPIDTIVLKDTNDESKLIYLMDRNCDGIIDLVGFQYKGQDRISSYRKPLKRVSITTPAADFADAIRKKKLPYPGLRFCR